MPLDVAGDQERYREARARDGAEDKPDRKLAAKIPSPFFATHNHDRVADRLLPSNRQSGQNAVDDVTVNIGEAHVTTAEPIRQLLVIKPEQPKNSRVKVVNFRDILHRPHTRFIGRAINEPALESASCQPNRKCCLVVIPAIRLGRMRECGQIPLPKQ